MGSAALAAFLLFGAYFERVAAKTGESLDLAFRVDIAQPDVARAGRSERCGLGSSRGRSASRINV